MDLLKTILFSELQKPKPHAAVVQGIPKVNDSQSFLSAITFGQNHPGIKTTEDQHPFNAHQIENYSDQLINHFDSLAIDTLEFRIWGNFISIESMTGNKDGGIAVIAISKLSAVDIRNGNDFHRFEERLINSFHKRNRAQFKLNWKLIGRRYWIRTNDLFHVKEAL